MNCAGRRSSAVLRKCDRHFTVEDVLSLDLRSVLTDRPTGNR
jgi:hypothetical protein